MDENKVEEKNYQDDCWIQTYSGRKYNPLNPDPNTIEIEDIAHVLSLMCRFGGHCKYFYSVADHSSRCLHYYLRYAHRIELKYKSGLCYDYSVMGWLLLHDSPEGMGCADICRPLKHNLVGYKEIEEKNMKAIAERFDLPYPMPEKDKEIVKKIDNIMLMTEKRDLMAPSPSKWALDGVVKPDYQIIVPYSSMDSERNFLEDFYSIFGDSYNTEEEM